MADDLPAPSASAGAIDRFANRSIAPALALGAGKGDDCHTGNLEYNGSLARLIKMPIPYWFRPTRGETSCFPLGGDDGATQFVPVVCAGAGRPGTAGLRRGAEAGRHL